MVAPRVGAWIETEEVNGANSLKWTVYGISTLIAKLGLVNADFADIQTILPYRG